MNRNLEDYIRPGRRAHLVGIGGVSMASLAEVLKDKGVTVTGSDMRESGTVARLRSLGIPVAIGHRGESVAEADCVIRTAAVHNDNPEIAAALAAGIPVFERAEAWGALMRHYKNALCVAGTHGKTTTTSMCTHILLAAGRDPSVMLGGTLPILGGGHRVGHGDTIIAEACEYCDSFLAFAPTVAVILNVEEDHLDYFKDLDAIKRSFRRFAELLPPGGRLVVNADNAGASSIARGLDAFTFGLGEGADCTAADLREEEGCPVFDVRVRGERYAHVKLRVYGLHNVSNALAAAGAAYVLGVPGAAVEEGLASFTGAARRFEKKGSYHGADVYDDYAHHPDELRALLTMAKTRRYRRVVCAFQPHTYTRTAALFDSFARTLRLADAVVLAPIYAARETEKLGMSSEKLARSIPGAVSCESLGAVTDKLAELARPGDLILTVGAGDIHLAGEALVRLEEND